MSLETSMDLARKKIYYVGKTWVVKFLKYLFQISVFLLLVFLLVNVSQFLLRTQGLKLL